MPQYASDTKVSPEQTLMDIRKTLTKYNANGFSIAEDEKHVGVIFNMEGRRVRFVVPLPERNNKDYQHLRNNGKVKAGQFSPEKYEQAIRQRWRALLLTIKAKLESVESEIETFEEAFLAHIVLPDGRTMGDVALPQIHQSYIDGKMPPLLGSGN